MAPEPEKKRRYFHGHLSVRKYGVFATYINILIGYIETVIFYNFFFLASSVGVITIGPGLASLHWCFYDLSMNRTEKRYRLYWKHFKDSFHLPIIFFGFLMTAFWAGLIYLFYFCLLNLNTASWLIGPLILGVVLYLYSARVSAYVYLQYVRLALPFSTILKNAFLLSSGYWKNALLCDLAFLVLFNVPLFLIEYCWSIVLVITLAWSVLSCEMSLYSVVDQYAIKDESIDPAEPKEDEPNLKIEQMKGPDDQKKQ